MAKEGSAETEISCVYCGSMDNLGKDHVPPKGIFPPPRPDGLITVRACRACNGGASQDDEYLRTMLCLSQNVGESSEAQKNWTQIFRSLARPQARGMTNAFLQSMHPVQAKTWSGIYLGTMMGFSVNMERINRVIERTVRGLYFHEWKRRLPEDHIVDVFCADTLIGLPPENLTHFQQTIILPLASVDPKIIAPGVFSYRFLVAADGPASAWALTFYDRKTFLAITTPGALRARRDGFSFDGDACQSLLENTIRVEAVGCSPW